MQQEKKFTKNEKTHLSLHLSRCRIKCYIFHSQFFLLHFFHTDFLSHSFNSKHSFMYIYSIRKILCVSINYYLMNRCLKSAASISKSTTTESAATIKTTTSVKSATSIESAAAAATTSVETTASAAAITIEAA